MELPVQLTGEVVRVLQSICRKRIQLWVQSLLSKFMDSILQTFICQHGSGNAAFLRLTQILEVLPNIPCRLFEGSQMSYIDTSKVKNFNKIKNYSKFFYNAYYLTDVILNLNEDAEKLANMFMFCQRLKTVTGKNGKIFGNKVTNISSMFYNCTKLEKIDGTMDFSGIMNMTSAFYNCWNLVLNIDTIQNSLVFDYLSDTMEAFYNCKKLYGTFDIDIWLNIGGAGSYMLENYRDMFYRMYRFDKLYLGSRLYWWSLPEHAIDSIYY